MEAARERRIALFGGTFDPIHIGHLAVARAAERRFHLDEIHFIPTGRPPHKHRGGHGRRTRDRYAMVALACADHPRFIAVACGIRRRTFRAAKYFIRWIR